MTRLEATRRRVRELTHDLDCMKTAIPFDDGSLPASDDDIRRVQRDLDAARADLAAQVSTKWVVKVRADGARGWTDHSVWDTQREAREQADMVSGRVTRLVTP